MTNRPNPIGQPIPEEELISRLTLIRGTQFTPYENELVTEAADTIRSLLTANTNLQQQVKMLEDDKAELERVCKVQVEVVAELEDRVKMLEEALDHLAASIEAENERGIGVSGTLMSDMREARAALEARTTAKDQPE